MKFLLFVSLMLSGIWIQTGGSPVNSENPFSRGYSYLPNPMYGEENPTLNYILFSRDNPKEGCDLQPTEDAIKECRFNPKLKTKVILHGFVQDLTPDNIVYDIKDRFLQVDEDFNVVIFNWTVYCGFYDYLDDFFLNYDIANINTVIASLQLSSWIQFLQAYTGVDPSSFHLISHSMGAILSSYVGKTFPNLGQLTFLDAATPRIKYLPESLKEPVHTDALFVEAIHTGAGPDLEAGYGYLNPLAHIDYFPNGGSFQPKCFHEAAFRSEAGEPRRVISHHFKVSCRHDASFEYYISSFNKSCKFMGVICDSYEDYVTGKCSSENAPVCQMGFHAKRSRDLPIHSKCYLNTSPVSPFCLG